MPDLEKLYLPELSTIPETQPERLTLTDEQFRRQWEAQPLRRPIMPEEIARAVAFIVETPSMTGQMIALDGGQHLGWAQPGRDGGSHE